MNNKIDYNNLKYVVVSSGKKFDFGGLKDPLVFLNDIEKGKTLLEEAKNKQQNYLDYLNVIRRGSKNANKKKALANINIHFNARINAIKFIEDYGSMILEAKKLAKEQEGTGASKTSRTNEGERVKILTPNQMLKRLPIALAQIKAGNNSESLLNEIRQIAYSLYRSKEITKKVYNNIIKSIKV